MKNTVIMLVGIIVFLLTWLFFGLLFYLFSDLPFKLSCTHTAVIFFTLTIGWTPALIVVLDLDKELN